MSHGVPMVRLVPVINLRPTNRIVAVNGTEVSNLDDFLTVVSQANKDEPLRLSLLSHEMFHRPLH